MKNAIISLRNAVVEYDGVQVLKNVSLDIMDKQFVTLLGPSGCGKTTTLRIIGGFAEMASGELFFNGTKINNLPPHKREVNTVFQKYALFPHLNIYDNIAFGLRIKKLPEKEIAQRVSEMLKLVNMQGFEKRSINSLSGGQQQRIAIARAIFSESPILLLDEATSALDADTEKRLLQNLRSMTDKTVVIVTHRPAALEICDRVIDFTNTDGSESK